MTEETTNTVSFKDKEYDVADLSERGQALVSFIRSVRQEAAGFQARLSVLQAAEITFSKELEDIFNEPVQEELA